MMYIVKTKDKYTGKVEYYSGDRKRISNETHPFPDKGTVFRDVPWAARNKLSKLLNGSNCDPNNTKVYVDICEKWYYISLLDANTNEVWYVADKDGCDLSTDQDTAWLFYEKPHELLSELAQDTDFRSVRLVVVPKRIHA